MQKNGRAGLASDTPLPQKQRRVKDEGVRDWPSFWTLFAKQADVPAEL